MKIIKEYTVLVFIIIIFLIAVISNNQNHDLKLDLTLSEKEYIKNNPVILLGPDPDFAPVEFYEDGKFKGVVPDLVQYINNNTDLNIKMIKYETWDDVIKGIKRKEIDMLGAVSISENRKDFLDFSTSYLSIPNVFVTQKNSMIVVENDLSNLTVGAVRNSAKHDLLLEKYPNTEIVPVKNIQTGLEKVSMGDIDAYLGSMSQMTYYINEYKFSNLEINQALDRSLDYSYPIHFAVQKNNVALQSIINKVLKEMPKETKHKIIGQWMELDTSKFFISRKSLMKGIVDVFIIVLIFLIIINILRYELSKRTQKISKLNKQLLKELQRHKKMTNDISLSLISVIEIYDNYTKGHSKNVANYALVLANTLDFDENFLEECYYSALLHDLGKTIVPNEIVCKTGKLTTSEYEIIKKHSFYSYKILENIESFDSIAKNVLYHHEHYDGNGYPEGIKDENIPIIARIIAVADAFDAMTTNRTYRSKLTKEEAIEELKRCSGSQFDPDLVDLFIEAISEVDRITDIESYIG